VSYQNGFEDALELCIAETEDSSTRQEALEKMDEILTLIKENKFRQIKLRLGSR
jgi:hypothetical protein